MRSDQLGNGEQNQEDRTMAWFEKGEIKIEVDEDGFMMEPDQWNEAVAAALATTEGIETLTEEHWKVMNYLRNYFLEFGVAPMIRKLCKETGFPLKKIYELFPSGPAKGACKLAGLAKPTGCV
jgi:TusE/DsrC/DsvC family sulfur relay protein